MIDGPSHHGRVKGVLQEFCLVQSRIRDAGGTLRILYIANSGDAVYVLHCFQKKSQKTA
ncbi:MAG: type II toxin-antitoxin system RelE/ParE family toxin [Agrobacterium tumefaciens]